MSSLIQGSGSRWRFDVWLNLSPVGKGTESKCRASESEIGGGDLDVPLKSVG